MRSFGPAPRRPVEEILPLLTSNPARLIGRDNCIGTLDPGKDADIVLLDAENNVTDTFVKGVQIHKNKE